MLVFFDVETTVQSRRLQDIGALKPDGSTLHTDSRTAFADFVRGEKYICGHNIFSHDLLYVQDEMPAGEHVCIDTLPYSVLLFPRKPFHPLVKDDKLVSEERNNPLLDARRAMDLFFDEVEAFMRLSRNMQEILYTLLQGQAHFSGFLEYLAECRDLVCERLPEDRCADAIREALHGRICESAALDILIRDRPVALAFCVTMIASGAQRPLFPRWLDHRYPQVTECIQMLCLTSCRTCGYCRSHLDVTAQLRDIFGFPAFRLYAGEPLQEKVARLGVEGDSFIAVFPTGGGKSVTFQLPAIMAGMWSGGLTLVISPLVSLMKDQIDHLEIQGITDAVAYNGDLSPLERSESIAAVESGRASMVYLAPESLRNGKTFAQLAARNIVRCVIDEAHCLSAWGQDFRVDYQYIGPFLQEMAKRRGRARPIPVSCFTATARPQVIADIRDYFQRSMGLDMEIIVAKAQRENLTHHAIRVSDKEDKYRTLRDLLTEKHCPTIVFTMNTRLTEELAQRLQSDHIDARPYHARMDARDKHANQDAFMRGSGDGGCDTIIATTAFSMGVDKPDIGRIILYDVPDSLENYVQEMGRAGRDPEIHADCYTLVEEDALDVSFTLLNQSKITLDDVRQLEGALRRLAGKRQDVLCSALELAREAGWNDAYTSADTKVTGGLLWLENGDVLKRQENVPHVYASGILVHTMAEASEMIEKSHEFSEQEKVHAKRIMSFLFSRYSHFRAGNDEAESRIDYIADRLGLETEYVAGIVQRLRISGILAKTQDMTAYLEKSEKEARAHMTQFVALETYLMDVMPENADVRFKELNEEALRRGYPSTVRSLRILIVYWMVRGFMKKVPASQDLLTVSMLWDREAMRRDLSMRYEVSCAALEYLYGKLAQRQEKDTSDREVMFSPLRMLEYYHAQPNLIKDQFTVDPKAVDRTLLYLARTRTVELEGGFFVTYNAMKIHLQQAGKRSRFRSTAYALLAQYYSHRTEQIHIMGRYLERLLKDPAQAQQLMTDYFSMPDRTFLRTYFPGDEASMLHLSMSRERYDRLIAALSRSQKAILDARENRVIVAAGPGSGKTRVLVHKLASLLLLEDVRPEQLLMLTFSRSAAAEFTLRLKELVGNRAYYVDIKTFHSFCFDLLGRVGNVEDSGHVVAQATEYIRAGKAEGNHVSRTCLVIDEAQDMDEDAYQLVCALLELNPAMRLIAVGDDDQNIFSWRGSSARYMEALLKDGGTMYSLLENYRSDAAIVDLANRFVTRLAHRMKTEPIRSVTGEKGRVEILSCTSPYLTMALLDKLKKDPPQGSACILLRTNEEAALMASLLNYHGLKAFLVQSTDGFSLPSLLEIRTFLSWIGNEQAKISEETWNELLARFRQTFSESPNYAACRQLFHVFGKTVQQKYRSDLETFLYESNVQDFLTGGRKAIWVSTIHRAKGREYDSVYMGLEAWDYDGQEALRAMYVGMTRARHHLTIVCHGNLFDEQPHETDTTVYPQPDTILYQCTMRDVYLGYAYTCQKAVCRLHAGMPLFLEGKRLYAVLDGCRESVAALSRNCQEKVENYLHSGYRIEQVQVRYLVYWKERDAAEEALVVLPDIQFIRKGEDSYENTDRTV